MLADMLSLEVTVVTLTVLSNNLFSCLTCQTSNSTLIGSLVRLRDNHLHLAESERILRNEDKFQELVDLYSSKGLHKKGGCNKDPQSSFSISEWF